MTLYRYRRFAAAVWFFTAVTLFSSSPIFGDPGKSPSSEGMPNGIHITAYHKSGYADPHLMNNILYKIKGMMPIFLWTTYYDPETTPPHIVTVDPRRTPDITSLNPIFEKLREKGIPIALAVYVDPQTDNSWRGEHLIDVQSYSEALASALKQITCPIDYLLLSSELSQTETEQETAWTDLISSLRSRYPNCKILYALDKSSSVLRSGNPPAWMNHLDYLGATLYHGGTEKVVAEKMAKSVRALDLLNQKTHTHGFIGELGISSAAGALEEPWKTVTECLPDEAVQLAFFETALPAINDLPYCIWRIEPSRWNAPCDFSPLDKKAEKFLFKPHSQTEPAQKGVSQESVMLFNSQTCLANCKINCRYFSCDDCVNHFERNLAEIAIPKDTVRISIFGRGFASADTCYANPSLFASLKLTDTGRVMRKEARLQCRGGSDFDLEFQFEKPINGGHLTIISQTGDWCVKIRDLNVQAILSHGNEIN